MTTSLTATGLIADAAAETIARLAEQRINAGLPITQTWLDYATTEATEALRAQLATHPRGRQILNRAAAEQS